jgi:hypothetical protein
MKLWFRAGVVAFALLALSSPATALATTISATTAPALTGTATVDATLTCSTIAVSAWTTTDSGSPSAVDVDYAFYYLAAGSVSSIQNSPSQSYKVQSADVGQRIVCAQTDRTRSASSTAPRP